MRPITDEERKQINIELLSYFDKVCRENDIHYSLTGGTLLGAVRHKGFIPWDDDVDVFMARPEFEKLDKAFTENGLFTWVSPTNGKENYHPYGRLYDKRTVIVDSPMPLPEGTGMFLDVCVVDGLPDNSFLRNLHIRKMILLRQGRRAVMNDENKSNIKEKSIVKKTIKGVLKATTNAEFWMKRIEKTMMKYAFDSGKLVGNFTSQYGKREVMHRSSWDSYIELEFEGHMFEACVGWEEYLKNIYGDYMILPPEANRVGHHEGKICWRN